LLLSYIVYLKAKNAPITKPGMAMISDSPIMNERKIAKTPQLSEPIITIRIADLVVAKSPDVIISVSIKVILWFVAQKE
jgi:hypothetical protein